MNPKWTTSLASWLLARHPATFGRVIEFFVVFWAAALCSYLPLTQSSERVYETPANDTTATILHPFRGPTLMSPMLETGLVVGVWIFATLWLFQRLLPFSAWLTAILFTLAWAVRLENMGKTIHVSHLTALLLWVLAWWRQETMAEFRAARAQGQSWSGLYYPEWVFQSCLVITALFYGWAGWSKLAASGLDWANGISMQIWTRLWGNPNFFATQWVLESRPISMFLQTLSLALEVFAPLAILPIFRTWIGLGLIGMHLGIVTIFGWGFHGNMIFIALLMLPFRQWLEEGRLDWKMLWNPSTIRNSNSKT